MDIDTNEIMKKATNIKKNNWRKEQFIEWRWRLFLYNDFKYIEVSYLKYDEDNRIFLNNKGDWVMKEIEPDFKDNLLEIKYYYCH